MHEDTLLFNSDEMFSVNKLLYNVINILRICILHEINFHIVQVASMFTVEMSYLWDDLLR